MEIEYYKINKNNLIIDVRNSRDYDEYHVDKSINISKLKLLSKPEKYLNKNKIVYLICDKGEVSMYCSKVLNALGYKCLSIKGGIESII